ncbi:MAG: hypothetical protein DMG91_04005 [Acidobacteria bacterium]|nr:MAG: hypothetical protein DMG91_04005 [Acidobacteriota bacterium]
MAWKISKLLPLVLIALAPQCVYAQSGSEPSLGDVARSMRKEKASLSKLDGPAVINGDALEVSVHNASSWSVTEITVGLTILRSANPANVARTARSKVIWAADVTPLNPQKLSDVTVLHHLKGTVDPSGTAVFRELLNTPVAADQDWHWAIVGAKGLPAQQATTGSAEQNSPASDSSPKLDSHLSPQN